MILYLYKEKYKEIYNMIPTEKDAIIETIKWLKNKEPSCNYCDYCRCGWQEKYKKECLKNQKRIEKEHIIWERKMQKWQNILNNME